LVKNSGAAHAGADRQPKALKAKGHSPNALKCKALNLGALAAAGRSGGLIGGFDHRLGAERIRQRCGRRRARRGHVDEGAGHDLVETAAAEKRRISAALELFCPAGANLQAGALLPPFRGEVDAGDERSARRTIELDRDIGRTHGPAGRGLADMPTSHRKVAKTASSTANPP
jgi:hypothetical protein